MKTLQAEKLEDKLTSIRRVIVAVDLTKHSEATAHYAAEIAKCFNASLYVAHVFASEGFYEFGGESAYNIVDQRRRSFVRSSMVLPSRSKSSFQYANRYSSKERRRSKFQR